MAVYGGQEPPFTEDLRPQPIDPYGVAKYSVEVDLALAGEQFGLKYNYLLRPHNVLGTVSKIFGTGTRNCNWYPLLGRLLIMNLSLSMVMVNRHVLSLTSSII